jgi:lambda family phage portal protein
MKATLLDRVISRISPEAGVKRTVAKLRAQGLAGLDTSQAEARDPFNVMPSGPSSFVRQDTRWRGASHGIRSMAAWITSIGSGRSDNSKYERDRMTARSFDAYRNHLIARAAVTRLRTNVVGTGIAAHPDVDADVLGMTEQEADEFNALVLREFTLYYDNPQEVDIESTLDGAGLQSLVLVTALLSGDCWALTPFLETTGGLYGLKIQLVDPARVSNVNNQPDTLTLQDGVEISTVGVPIAIHIARRHPADKSFGVPDVWDRREIFSPTGARRVLQVWNDKDRIGTTRGVPYLAPILEPLQTLEQYSRAELIAAVISAMFTVFITKDLNRVDAQGNPLPFVEGETVKGEPSGIALGNGAVLDLAPGEDAKFANPTRPNANYDPFFMSIVRQIGAALELPVDELLLNYQQSYSAARAAMLQAYRMYTMRRWWLVQQFCAPHYRLWFDEAVARGRIKVTGYDDPVRRAAYQKAMWIGPAKGAMDENQEAQAALARINAGVSNETIETAAMTGEDWLSVYKQRRREVKQRQTDGMVQGPAPGQAAGTIQQPNKANKTESQTVPSGVPEDE